MMSGLIEGGAAILIAIAGGLYVVGQMRENARKNEKDIEVIKKLITESQESMLSLLEKAMEDVKQLIDHEKEHSRENLGREIAHIKDLLNMTAAETREDIKRLESAQRESNRVKERLAITENSVRSLHHRLDIEPPISFKEHED